MTFAACEAWAAAWFLRSQGQPYPTRPCRHRAARCPKLDDPKETTRS